MLELLRTNKQEFKCISDEIYSLDMAIIQTSNSTTDFFAFILIPVSSAHKLSLPSLMFDALIN